MKEFLIGKPRNFWSTNNPEPNWQHFTIALLVWIINTFMQPLTAHEHKDVFIIDNSLFDRYSFSKTELLNIIRQNSMVRRLIRQIYAVWQLVFILYPLYQSRR